jgi:dipeptidase D
MDAHVFKGLEPSLVWKYFKEICEIPRPSKKEEKIIEYLIDFAKQHNLESKKDNSGNLLISKPASRNAVKKPIVVLQSHVDMVCEKNASTVHNFESDAIVPFVEDGWVKAKGTTLGGDDGIGVATQLAILASDNIMHGPVECLFTVDEETGLTGAFGLESNFFSGKILLNLDSEDEGIIFIGCAGGMDTIGNLKVETIPVKPNFSSYIIEISGLQGGHSGDDINKGLGNAIKIAARISRMLFKKYDIQIIDIQGGNLINTIAREAYIDFACGIIDIGQIKIEIEKLAFEIKNELKSTEQKLQIEIKEINNDQTCLSNNSANTILALLYSLPHGTIGMSNAIPGLVETSTNLASVKRINANMIEVSTSQRSSLITLKTYIAEQVASVFKLAGGTYTHSIGYPGWNPNPDSKILKIATESYIELFKKEPVVTAIHAGLECGLFLDKYPHLDMISFGPTIKGAHSPDERLEIESVDKFWRLLLKILEEI